MKDYYLLWSSVEARLNWLSLSIRPQIAKQLKNQASFSWFR